MTAHTRRLRTWYQVHKWTSLVRTLFLLVICATGLPLVFSEEIGHWLSDDPPYADLPTGTPTADLDGMVRQARQRYPHEIVTSVFVDDDEPQVVVGMAPSWQDSEDRPDSNHSLKFDARTARLIKESDPPGRAHLSFMDLMLRLHTDLFAGLPGELFMGAMGLLFATAIVSGVVLYGPFMKKLKFGTVRRERARRLKWLDLHNLLGIVTLIWALTLGLTGVLNELSTLLFSLWQRTDVQAMLAPYQGQPLPDAQAAGSPQAAYATASAAVPQMRVLSVVFPGARVGSPYHYLLWAKGKTPLTSRLFSPVLVDARTGALTAVVAMPWYLRALEVSRPLHFGDYGGLPLKVLWVLLDLVTLVVLVSGLYLWLARHRLESGRVARIAAGRRPAAP